jgi:deazaflavin-dependent oxidoreductase (nitroreductase family)
VDKTELDRHNATVIEEFRANDGVVGGMYEGSQLLLLHTVGAKTGRHRINPLVCRPLDRGAFAIFASAGGAPVPPDWYHNLRRQPRTRIEIGTATVAVTARILDGNERDEIWAAHVSDHPHFANLAAQAGRTIPVIALEPVAVDAAS